jgi:tetratricopeptide (TPR) repeat protein
MIFLNPVFFLKGNHYLLESLFMLKYKSNFKRYLELLEDTISDPRFPVNDNIASLSFLYLYNNKLNYHILEGTFAESEYLIPEVLEKIKLHSEHLDEHHEMLFYYKIASIYFGNEKYSECIFYLEKIINNKNLYVREDLACFARLLCLIAHYESGKDFNLENQLISTYKFLIKMNDLHEVQKEIIRFLKKLNTIYPSDIKKEFIKVKERFIELEKSTYEKRAFLYLDIISWLESKIENRKISDIIKEKAKLNNR